MKRKKRGVELSNAEAVWRVLEDLFGLGFCRRQKHQDCRLRCAILVVAVQCNRERLLRHVPAPRFTLKFPRFVGTLPGSLHLATDRQKGARLMKCGEDDWSEAGRVA